VREIGCVISVKGGIAVVSMPMSGDCERCGACSLGGDGREALLMVKNSVGAGEGDTVEIEISAGRVIAAAFIVYMVPVLMSIVGFMIGSALSRGDENANLPIVMAVIFVVGSFFGVWLYDRRLRRTERNEAVAVRILSEDEVEQRKKHVTPAKLGG